MPVDKRVSEIRLVKDRLAWALAHPGVSEWVKSALASAHLRDPVEVLNDLELMTHVVRQWNAPRADAIGRTPAPDQTSARDGES